MSDENFAAKFHKTATINTNYKDFKNTLRAFLHLPIAKKCHTFTGTINKTILKKNSNLNFKLKNALSRLETQPPKESNLNFLPYRYFFPQRNHGRRWRLALN